LRHDDVGVDVDVDAIVVVQCTVFGRGVFAQSTFIYEDQADEVKVVDIARLRSRNISEVDAAAAP
jgi:hypothetical protein